MPSDQVLSAVDVSKQFGGMYALKGVSITAPPGEVTCLLGDNGAGKSTLIKILSGVHAPTSGTLQIGGTPVSFGSPRDALEHGIATVYQDLSTIPLMSVVRNFFLGREPVGSGGAFRRVDWSAATEVAEEQLLRVGIRLKSKEQTVGTLSGGERQSLAIARAIHFGASVLILDEPTSALGVREGGLVLRHILDVREQGVAVVFITHNVAHATLVGDRFVVLNHGEVMAQLSRGEATREELHDLMAGGEDMRLLREELDL